jgi:GAF domain-containing protein/HAMP domain-containing protein
MNRQTLSFPISVKLLIGIFVAVAVPVAVVVLLSIEGSNRITVNNLQAFVRENGLRRLADINEAFSVVQNNILSFVDNNVNRSILASALRVRQGGAVSSQAVIEVANRAQETMLSYLMTDPRRFIESAWLLTPEGRVVAPVTALNKNLPFNLQFEQESRSDVFLLAQNLTPSDGLRLVVANRNGVVNFEAVIAILDVRNAIVGYLVVDLNLDTLVFANLRASTDQYDTYSFLVMPDGVSTLQLLAVRTSRRVFTNTVGVERALNGEEASVATYSTGENGERSVIGFYTSLTLYGTRFAFVTELDTAFISTQRASYIAQVAFPVVMGLSALVVVIVLFLNQLLAPPLMQLREAIRAMMVGSYDVPVTSEGRGDEIGVLSAAFLDMRAQVTRLINDMTERLEERNRDVRITQDISRVATAERNLKTLLDKVVQLIIENFPNIYHAQVFLVDQEGEYAVLRASTGKAGEQLLSRGHRLAVGSVSVIGQVTEQGQVVVARDISASNVHRQNEFLQETQAELAIPLRLGSRVVGALDVQSKQRDSFTPQQIDALQTLADQLSIAIENTRLYEESQRLLASLELEKDQRTRFAWRDYINSQRDARLASQYGNPTGYDGTELRQAALQSGQAVVGEKTARNTIPFAVPIRLRGQTLGVVEYEMTEADFNYNKVLLAEELVSRLAISLDNARLFQGSVQAVERERLVNEISAKLTSQTDIQDIIETALREVGQALRTPQVAIRFNVAAGRNGSGNGHHADDTRQNGHSLSQQGVETPQSEE